MIRLTAFHHAISRIIVLLATAAMAPMAMAQTDALVTQYHEVPSMYNPALTGTTDYVRIRAGARWQWVGVDDAPRKYALVADAPFRLGDFRMGAGAVVLRDTYGSYSALQASAQLSAKIKVLGGDFSLAIQAGAFNQRFKSGEEHSVSGHAVDLGLGVAYSRDKWHVALSGQRLTSPSISFGEITSTGLVNDSCRFEAKPTLYFQAGCNIAIKNTLFEVIPSVIAATDFYSHRGMASVRMRYRGMLSAGIGYDCHEGVSLVLGAEIKNFYIGYSYEFGTSGVGKSSSGSHEAWLGYAMKLNLSGKTRHRHRSVRFM